MKRQTMEFKKQLNQNIKVAKDKNYRVQVILVNNDNYFYKHAEF